MRNIKTIFILVLSLILLFAVSCSNEDKTGITGGVTATYYKGHLTCKSCIINDFHSDNSTSKEDLEQGVKNLFTTGFFYLKIANNKLKWGEVDEQEIENMEEVVALKSGSEYSVTYSSEENTADYSSKYKKNIRFTISGDTISITAYIAENLLEHTDGKYKFSLVATYEGTLDKYTPTTSSGS